MTALIRAQLTQLRTLRSTYVVAIAVVLVAAGITWADLADAGGAKLDSPGELRNALILDVGIVSALFAAMFATLGTASEYRHQTIGLRVLAAPRRLSMLVARLFTYGGLSAVAGLAALGVSYALAGPVLDAKGLSLGLSSSELAGIAAEVGLASVLFSMIGVAVGFICRSPAAAAMVVGGWFIVEKSLADLLGSAHDYLPYALLNSVLDVEGAMAPAAAGLALCGVTAVMATASGALLLRRDVG